MGRFEHEVVDDDSSTASDDSKFDSDSDIGETEDNHDDVSPFSEGEKVFAFHKDRFYISQVRKIKFQAKEWKYFVHYLGWKKRWDEWVDVDHLKKFTEENVKKQKAVDQKLGIDSNIRPGRASLPKPRNSTLAKEKKQKKDFVVKEESAREKLVKIHIPFTLKKRLVDDCEFVVHQGKLVKLPHTRNIEDIMHRYLDYKLKHDGIRDSLVEFLKGLQNYFDKAVQVMLLYKSEHQQYQDLVVDQISPSKVYGAEHLLRLFVKFPDLLLQANIEEESLTDMQWNLIDFLKFLHKNQDTIFLSSYYVAKTIGEDQDG